MSFVRARRFTAVLREVGFPDGAGDEEAEEHEQQDRRGKEKPEEPVAPRRRRISEAGPSGSTHDLVKLWPQHFPRAAPRWELVRVGGWRSAPPGAPARRTIERIVRARHTSALAPVAENSLPGLRPRNRTSRRGLALAKSNRASGMRARVRPEGVGDSCYRWYEPQTGRYTRVDPLAVATGIDIFSYANDNPLSQTDSLGLRPALDCCGLAKARGLFGSAGGTVICCSGTKVPCIDIPAFSTAASPVARAVLQDCATKHERQHFGDVDCPPCGITSPPFRNGKPQQAESECKASRVEWKCLVAKRSQCGSDVACREALRLREVQIQNYGGSFGKPCTF